MPNLTRLRMPPVRQLLLLSILFSCALITATSVVGAPRREEPKVTYEILQFTSDGQHALGFGLFDGRKTRFCRWNLTEATRDDLDLTDLSLTWPDFPLAVSADGKWLALAVARDTIRFRALEDKGVGRAFEIPQGFSGITSLSFSPDGKVLLARGERGTRAFDVATGRAREWRDSVQGEVVFSPDGRLVADRAAQVCVYDTATGQVIRRLAHNGEHGLWFSPTGRQLLVWSGPLQPTVFVEIASGREVWRDKTPVSPPRPLGLNGYALSILLRSGMPAAAGAGEELVEVAAGSGREIRRLPWEEALPKDLLVSPDGKRALSGGNFLVFWDLENGREIRTLGGPRWDWTGGRESAVGRYFAMAFAPDGSRVVTVHDDVLVVSDAGVGRVAVNCQPRPGERYIDTGDNKPNQSLRIWSSLVDWDRGIIYAGYGDGAVVGWRLEDGKIALTFQANATHPPNEQGLNGVTLLGLSSGGKILHTQHLENKKVVVNRWDLRTKQKISSATSTAWEAYPLAGHLARLENGTLTLYDDEGRNEWAIGFAEQPRWLSVVQTGGTERLAIVDSSVTFLNLKTGREVGRREFPKVKPGNNRPVALSGDGRAAVGGTANGQIWLWDLERETARELIPRGWTGPVVNVAFSADGKRVLGGMSGGKLCLWDTTTGKELAHWYPVTPGGFEERNQK
jgi:WD40 repeat protein